MTTFENNQNVMIDEAAANRDIRRITNALPSLQEARATLQRVQNQGSQTQGKTGTAIVEKSTELIGRIDKLISSLEQTKSLLRKTVIKYQDTDEKLAKAAKDLLEAWRF